VTAEKQTEKMNAKMNPVIEFIEKRVDQEILGKLRKVGDGNRVYRFKEIMKIITATVRGDVQVTRERYKEKLQSVKDIKTVEQLRDTMKIFDDVRQQHNMNVQLFGGREDISDKELRRWLYNKLDKQTGGEVQVMAAMMAVGDQDEEWDVLRERITKHINSTYQLGGHERQEVEKQKDQREAHVVNMAKQGVQACYRWEQKGQCKYGDGCKFQHAGGARKEREQTRRGGDRTPAVCWDWLEGKCRRGSQCRFTHEDERGGRGRQERSQSPMRGKDTRKRDRSEESGRGSEQSRSPKKQKWQQVQGTPKKRPREGGKDEE